MKPKNIVFFEEIKKEDISLVGGKGANLGEMFNHFPIPNGFCITVHAYHDFMAKIGEHIHGLLDELDIEGTEVLDKISKQCRDLMLKQKFPAELKKEIETAYK